jgi:hypothetical protein
MKERNQGYAIGKLAGRKIYESGIWMADFGAGQSGEDVPNNLCSAAFRAGCQGLPHDSALLNLEFRTYQDIGAQKTG